MSEKEYIQEEPTDERNAAELPTTHKEVIRANYNPDSDPEQTENMEVHHHPDLHHKSNPGRNICWKA